jgi:hypothetical protein
MQFIKTLLSDRFHQIAAVIPFKLNSSDTIPRLHSNLYAFFGTLSKRDSIKCGSIPVFYRESIARPRVS